MKKGFILLMCIIAMACAHKKAASPASAPASAPAAAPPAPVRAPEPTPVEPNVVTPVTETPSAEILSYSLEDLNKKGLLKDTFFDYDKSDIKTEFRDSLEQNAQFLSRNRSVKIMIEGHCDERGTREYNIALGNRRAEAVRQFLTALGVDGARMQTISYGREKPFTDCHDESCWSQNRRAHFVILSK